MVFLEMLLVDSNSFGKTNLKWFFEMLEKGLRVDALTVNNVQH